MEHHAHAETVAAAPHGGDHDARAMALSATLHCLTGCAIGEVLGLLIGTAAGWAVAPTIALSVGLAFLFGYLLSTLPLLRTGMAFTAALGLVLAADTLSIATMEVVDNAVMALVPGAMDAGLDNPVFWLSMMLAFTAAFAAAYPVNVWLMGRGKGHALTHGAHADGAARPWVPAPSTPTLVAMLVAFMVGGLTVAVAGDSGDQPGEPAGGGGGHAAAPVDPGLGSVHAAG